MSLKNLSASTVVTVAAPLLVIVSMAGGAMVDPLLFLIGPGIAALAALTLINVDWLPAIAFGAYILLPVTSAPVPDIVTVVSPSLIVILVWLVRCPRPEAKIRDGFDRWQHALIWLILFWMLISTIWSEYKMNAAGWGFTFAITALIIGWRRLTHQAIANLMKAWTFLAACLALYALVEFATKTNFLWGPIYAAGPYPPRDSYAVYRVSASLGHTLNASTFFAVSMAAMLGYWLATGRRKLLLIAGLCAAALALTSSRGGMLAGAIAAVVVFVFGAAKVRKQFGTKMLVVLGAFGAGLIALTVGPLAERLISDESYESGIIRDKIVALAMQTAEVSGFMGFGPGSSRPALIDITGTHLILENSYLQLLVSVGAPGLILIGLLIFVTAIRAIAAQQYAALGALAAYAISIGGFNFIEAQRPAHLILGVIMLLAWGPAIPKKEERAPKLPEHLRRLDRHLSKANQS